MSDPTTSALTLALLLLLTFSGLTLCGVCPPRGREALETQEGLPESLCPNVKIFFNDAFDHYAKHTQGKTAPDAIARYINMTNRHFSLPSLTTRIHINFTDIVHVEGNVIWRPDNKRDVFKHVGGEDASNIHQYIFFTKLASHRMDHDKINLYQKLNEAADQLPFSRNSVCSDEPEQRVAVVDVAEKREEDVAFTVTRYLGFALGMDADYKYITAGGHQSEDRMRESRSCFLCNEVGGIMEIDVSNELAKKWTFCSKEGLLDYYNAVMVNGTDGFCIDACPFTPTTPTTTTTTPRSMPTVRGCYEK